jgi:hypothetical protein
MNRQWGTEFFQKFIHRGWRGTYVCSALLKESNMNDELEIQAVRARLSKLEAEVRFLYKHLGVTFVPTFELDPTDKAVVEFLKKGD